MKLQTELSVNDRKSQLCVRQNMSPEHYNANKVDSRLAHTSLLMQTKGSPPAKRRKK